MCWQRRFKLVKLVVETSNRIGQRVQQDAPSAENPERLIKEFRALGETY